MARHEPSISAIHTAVADALGLAVRQAGAPVVLAVSGGIDSMVLLDAAVATVSRDRVIVATFDHATGRSATRASALVGERTAALGVEWTHERASAAAHSEADLRDARWGFLRRVSSAARAVVCTAHSLDDHIETVLMRVMRGSGTRGLAGLYARSSILRPLLPFTRADIVRYAAARELEWVEDPSNRSRRYLRNRLRHDLLPALRTVHAEFEAELLALAGAAARWRDDVEQVVDRLIGECPGDVPAAALAERSADELSVLWPALVARSGLALDRRGTARLADFTRRARVGSRIQLSGGWDVVRSRAAFQLRQRAAHAPPTRPLAVSRPTRWGSWTFCPSSQVASARGLDVADRAWSANLPPNKPLSVRQWRAGDTMVPHQGAAPRRVKRLLSAAGVTGHDRAGWPVVLAGDEIVWIPGVRRGQCAGAQSGQSGLAFMCERING